MYILVFFIIGAFIGISQSAGIGGGPILNICLMIGLGLTSRNSMCITYLFLMGGSLATMLMNYRKKNSEGYPIMDYNLILLTLPMIMSGSIYGVNVEFIKTVLNSYFSEFIITICFTLLLSYLAYNSYEKYQQTKIQSSLKQSLKKTKYQINLTEHQFHPELLKLIQNQKNPFQKDKFIIAFLILLYTVAILLIRGGKTYDSIIGLQRCQIGYWIFNILHITLSYNSSKSVATKIFKIQQQKQSLGYIFRQNQKHNQLQLRNCMIYGFIAGLAGGCLGLGGAIILVPVWLNSGIDKQIATSSSGPLIFLSSLSAFFIASLGGAYHTSAIGYFMLSFFSSLIVKRLVVMITLKFNLRGMVYILLFLTMTLSIFTLLPFQVIQYFSDGQRFMNFGLLC